MPTKKKTSPKKVVPPVAPLLKAKTEGVAILNKPVEKQGIIKGDPRVTPKTLKNLEKGKWKKGQSGNPK